MTQPSRTIEDDTPKTRRAAKRLKVIQSSMPNGEIRSEHAAQIPDTQIVSEWVYVTADLMREWLDRNVDNRHLDESHIKRLMSDMQADRWLITHQGIAFDDNGILRDGQHRGTAQVRLGVDRWWLVTRGLPAHAQTEMDGGKKRQVPDFMSGKNIMIRAAASRTYLAFRATQPDINEIDVQYTMARMTTASILESMDEPTTQKLLHLSGLAADAGKVSQVMTGSALLAASAFALSQEQAEDFLRGFVAMTGLPDGDPRIAILKLRGVPGQRTGKHRLGVMALKCAVAFRDGTSIRILKPAYQQSVKCHEFGTVPKESEKEVAQGTLDL